MPHPCRAFVALWIATVSLSTALRSATVFDDTFVDGERRTQNLPTSVAWFQNGTQATGLTVNGGTLVLNVANASRTLWTYFPAITLKVGESITLSLAFTFTDTTNSGFRVGLCHTNGTFPRTTNGSGPTGNYQGYGMENLLLIKRDGAAGAQVDAQLVNQLGTPEAPVWNMVGNGGRVRGAPLAANTPYALTLTVTRTGPDAASLTETLTGGEFTATNTSTVVDAGNAFTTFDTIAIGLVGNTTNGDMRITRAQVTTTVVPSTTGRLANMSIRTHAGTGDDTLIVGVGVGGAGTIGSKAALFRAIGPTLGAFGVEGTLADPIITAFQGAVSIAQNDDWGGGFDFGSVGAFALAGATPRDAALYNGSVTRGSYSLQITGKNNGTGIALAEIYDATPAGIFTSTTSRLVNVSARTQVGTGDNILIAGFVVGGSASLRVVIRAIGPTLGGFGVTGALANPRLDVLQGTVSVGANDDWAGTAELKAAFTSVGAFPLASDTSRDAALIVALPPGSYTAQISGVGATTGIALVEIYELP